MNKIIEVLNPQSKSWETKLASEGQHITIIGMVITPEIAKEMLKGNQNNRRLRQNKVEKYAKDMREGKFEYGVDKVAFDCNRNLANGQHRLAAIVMSGVPCKLDVAFGYTQPEIERFDGVDPRDLVDLSHYAKTANAFPFALSVSTYMFRQTLGCRKPSDKIEQLDMYERYAEMFVFVNDIFRPQHRAKGSKPVDNLGKIGNVVGAAFARAYMTFKNNPAKLERLRLMALSLADDSLCLQLRASKNKGDSAFNKLVSFLIDAKKRLDDGNQRVVVYHKTENAIAKFVNSQPMQALDSYQGELFKLDIELGCKETKADVSVSAISTRVEELQPA